MLKKDNLFADITKDRTQEQFTDLLNSGNTKVERIVSFGQSSPEHGWYDQSETEWVCVLKGYGVLIFENGQTIRLDVGDHLTIPAHCKHKVIETDASNETLWLAVFIK
ncbi:cupin domain-containing protein [Pseudoalteromonas piratica]|uniref:Cupin n=1 Tax=Pseudoalteromonas piratica TaxID=1348114 RepID=A0A0A7EKL5_9GAMM|nr:cupin domain-containing protein [Pseudoalteromonas piratica]AIY67169.1 cupin [Pseudoalteromonas piratica]